MIPASIVRLRSVAAWGPAESYCDGYWSCDDLTALIRIFSRNMQASTDLGGAWNSLLDLGTEGDA